jgi:hypothetical protein
VVKLLQPLVFVVVACEAMAQDAQCVAERAAMVETIRAYARSQVDVLGPQGAGIQATNDMNAAAAQQMQLDPNLANMPLQQN